MILLIIILLLLCSCSSEQMVQRIEVHDTVRIVQVQRDSVLCRDSIYVREYTQGDTIYITQWRERWRERVVMVHDTLQSVHNSQCDSVVVMPSHQRDAIPKVYRIALWMDIIVIIVLLLVIAWRIVHHASHAPLWHSGSRCFLLDIGDDAFGG